MYNYNYIINPIDRKKVDIKSELGKKILQNYLKFYDIGSKSTVSENNKPISTLETINEEPISYISESEKLCLIKGVQICKDIAPLFKSPFNILNYISHDKNGNLNNINFDKKLYIKIDTKHSGLTGSYGGIVDNIFENEKTNDQIRISEKIMRSHLRSSGGSLDELKILKKYPYLNEICPHIIPIRILDNRVYMLRGNGDLNDLINNSEIKLHAGMAHQIVNCIKKTLLGLLEHDIYYFDLKPGNIIYQCFDDKMYVWLVDLGSMLADKHGYYVATYPHPVINCLRKRNNKYEAGIITKEVYGFNLSQKQKHEQIKDIYAYQLSQLFFNLISLNRSFTYKYITKEKPLVLRAKLKSVVEKVENSGYKYRLIKNYTGVFKEIINGIKVMFGPAPREYPPLPWHEEFWL